MFEVRIGVIGIGNIGTAHAAALAAGEVEDAVLTAVCDMRSERLDFCKENFPKAMRFYDYEELIDYDGVDAVIIAVPHRLHAEIAKAAFAKGKHVLIEKPEDISASAAAGLNEIAEKSNRVFAIMFQQRLNPVFKKAREIVKSGALGQLKRSVWIVTNWYRTQRYYDSGDWRASWLGEGGGVLLNQAPHNLDLWQWICGMPDEITAFCDNGKYHNIEVEDDVTIYAKYPNGATGVFITSTGEYPGTNRFEIAGDLGKIVIENGALKWWKLPCSEREICFECEEGFPEIEMEYEEFRLEEPKTPHTNMITDFVKAIMSGKKVIAPGIEGINELSISNAAYLSSWKGNVPIKLPLEGDEFSRELSQRIKNSCGKKETATLPCKATAYERRWKVNW